MFQRNSITLGKIRGTLELKILQLFLLIKEIRISYEQFWLPETKSFNCKHDLNVSVRQQTNRVLFIMHCCLLGNVIRTNCVNVGHLRTKKKDLKTEV